MDYCLHLIKFSPGFIVVGHIIIWESLFETRM